MNLPHTLTASVVAAVLLAQPAWASEGHDHGEAPAAVGQALPRFTAESELFELVGVLSGRQITLYLDRFGDNSPVRDAEIELEIGNAKFKARAFEGQQGEDAYEVVLPEAPKAGVLPVTATVTAGKYSDLLVGELDIHGAAHSDEGAQAFPWKRYAAWGAAVIAVIAVLALLIRGGRRLMVARSVSAGGAA